MPSFICTLCGRVFSQQSGLTHHRCSTHAHLHPTSRNLSTSNGLDYDLADDILQYDDNTLSQPPEMEIIPNAGAPINDTVRVHSLEDDDWDPLALFATHQQRQQCNSIVDTNQCKTKLNNILKGRLILPDAIANNPDLLYQLIQDMEAMDVLVCGWEERSVHIEGKRTPFRYRAPVAAVQYILGDPPFKNHFSYVPVNPMDSSGECIYTEMWTSDLWCKTQASFLVLSERSCLVRFSLCLGELECQRDHVRESMIERSCKRERAKENVSERTCQRERVRENVSERMCQRECVRENVSESMSECVSQSVSGSVIVILSERACQRAW